MTPYPQNTIDAYRAAYRRANGSDIKVVYVKGWFRIRAYGCAIGTKHRRKEVEQFTAKLNERPALTANKGSE